MRQFGPVVEAVDEGEKVGGVKKEAPQIQAKARDRCDRQFLFNLGDGLFLNAVHVVPKALAGQLGTLDAEQARQNGLVIPFTHFGLATRGDTPVEAGDQEVLAHGRSLVPAFGDMSVDGGYDVELLGYVEGRNQGAELADDDVVGLRIGKAPDQLLTRADVFCPNDLRLAVDALTLPQIVVGPAADDLLGEARHDVRSYTISHLLSRCCVAITA